MSKLYKVVECENKFPKWNLVDINTLNSKYVYIAGPIKGIADYNKPMFCKVEKALRDVGAMPYNPATMPPSPEFFYENQRFYWERYLGWITNKANAIVMLPDSEFSEGAMLEQSVARMCGIDVYYWEE